jgi:hypothetical protein
MVQKDPSLSCTGYDFNPLNAELNPICHLLALLGHHILHVSRIRVKSEEIHFREMQLFLLHA